MTVLFPVAERYPLMEDGCIMKPETSVCLFISLTCLLHLAPYQQVSSCFALKVSNHIRPALLQAEMGSNGNCISVLLTLACLEGKYFVYDSPLHSPPGLTLEAALRDCSTSFFSVVFE